MVAVALEQAEHCSGCGLTQREYDEDPDAYQAVQTVCPWCALKDRANSDGDTDRSIPGATIKLVPRAVAERVKQMVAARPLSRRERAKHR